MPRVEQDVSETYRSFSDQQIASLYAEIDSLTEVARPALLAEIERRSLSHAQLQSMHTAELRREANFDRRQAIHRKKVLAYLLRNDPKGVLLVFLAILAIALFLALTSSHH